MDTPESEVTESSTDPSSASSTAGGNAGAESGASAPAVTPDDGVNAPVDTTPESAIESNAGVEPSPLTPEPQHDHVLDYPSSVPTPEDGHVPGQEQPVSPDRAALVPSSDTRADATDPTAIVQQSDHPVYGLSDNPSDAEVAKAIVYAWNSVKIANWNVVSDEMDALVARLAKQHDIETAPAPVVS